MYIQKYYKVIRVIKDGDGGATPLYIENVSDSDGVFKLVKSSSPYIPNLIYRIDNGEWFEYDTTNLPSITVPSGSKIYFRGDNINGFNQDMSTGYRFNFSQNYNIGGYLTSLLALDNFNTITDIPRYSFSCLFNQQTTLLNAKDLITDNIIKVEVGSFYNFFQYCSSLSISPDFRNITTINTQGFEACFENCTSLQVVYVPSISTWNTRNFNRWLNNVSPTGIMYKPANLTIPTGTNGVPEGWTTVDY